jgi:hypothetical protein
MTGEKYQSVKTRRMMDDWRFSKELWMTGEKYQSFKTRRRTS